MTLVAVCSEINLSLKFKVPVSLLQLNIHTNFRSIILSCIVTQILMLLDILHAVVLFKQFFFQLTAQYLVLLLHVSTTNRGHRQGVTVFENIMQRGT